MEMDDDNQQVNQGGNLNQNPSSNPIINQKGNFLLIIGVVIVILIIGAGAYYLGVNKDRSFTNGNSQQLQVSPTTQSSPTGLPTSSTDNTTNWKTFTTSGINTGLTFKYPLNWVTPENTFISEKSFIVGEQDRSKTYNIIEIQKYSTQLYVGYTNSEWFDKINSLTESMSDQRAIRTKITSGKVTSGEPYVIFKDEPSASAQGGIFKQVKAYILKDQTIYQLTLDLYNDDGLDTFKKIIPTAVIN